MSGPSAPLLAVRELSVRFRGIVALDGVSFEIGRKQIVGLIGPNGAGKTTLFNCLSRLYAPASGDVLFEGRSILGMNTYDIARIGIGRTFQNVALFDSLNVLDNVLVGGYDGARSGFLASALGWVGVAREEARLVEEANGFLDFMALNPWRETLAGSLPFPIRKRVELARALMTRPKLLLLDEPAAGLNHEEVEALKAQILAVRDNYGVAVLLVEHHMNLVMSVSDKVVAIDFGRKISDGCPADVQADAEVIRAYLGEPA